MHVYIHLVAALHLKTKLMEIISGLWTQSSERYGRDTMEVLSVIEIGPQVSM
jgi:hypothetical protein